MKTFYAILILALVTLIPAFDLTAQNYIVDSGHTSIQTKVMRFGVMPVVGRFNDVSGTITYNVGDIEKTKANINIKVSSYSANNTGGEDAVKSEAFLDATNYPEIQFILSSLSKKNDQLIARGTLKLHGTKKEIECPVTITGPLVDLPTRKQSIGIVGNLSIDRTAYSAGKEMKLPNGTEVIGNEVKIEFVILALTE